MHGENYQDNNSTRVRHVPIQVESRGDTNRGYNSRQQTNDRQIYHENEGLDRQSGINLQNFHDNEYSQRTHSPSNTSSVNINYKPPPPQRRPNANNHDQFYEQQSSNPSEQQHDIGQSNRAHSNQSTQTHREARRSSRNRQSSNNPSPNSDKLVSSPEPIPLPPPPAQSQQQHQQAQQQPGGNLNRDQNDSSPPSQQQGHQQNFEQHGAQPSNQDHNKKDTSVLVKINSIKMEVTNLLPEITKFSGINAKAKEYRYIDEMLTVCMLNLDNIECGDASKLRQQRRAAIKMVDRATDILQRKLQINSDIHDLSESMSVPL